MGKRSEWNKFVSHVYHAGKKSNPSYKFSEALKDASKRKHEMKGGMAASMPAASMPAASMPAASMPAASKESMPMAPMSSDAPMMNKMDSTMGSSMTKKMMGGKRRRMGKMTKRKSRRGRKHKGSKKRR